MPLVAPLFTSFTPPLFDVSAFLILPCIVHVLLIIFRFYDPFTFRIVSWETVWWLKKVTERKNTVYLFASLLISMFNSKRSFLRDLLKKTRKFYFSVIVSFLFLQED